MKATGFAYSAEMNARAATGYHRRHSPMRYLLPRWVIGEPSGKWLSLRRFLLDGQAYGGLVGSVEDAARFLRMHICDGTVGERQILKPETARRMREIVVPGRRFDLGPLVSSRQSPLRRPLVCRAPRGLMRISGRRRRRVRVRVGL